MFRLAILEDSSSKHRRGHCTFCSAEGCSARSYLGKPYCPGHLHLQPHVAYVLEEIQVRSAEVERVKAGGTAAVRASDPVYKEILAVVLEIREGTVGRLARECGIVDAQKEWVEFYVRAMEKKRILKTRCNDRGNLAFRVVGKHSGKPILMNRKTATAL